MVERTENAMVIDFEFTRLAEAFFFSPPELFPSWRHIYSTISYINLVLPLSYLCFSVISKKS